MRINDNHWLKSKFIAHRGLWNENIIENSIPAYQNAADNGFPIEIDVYITTDGKLVSFHDRPLKRMTGEDGFIYEKSLAEIKELRLLGSEQKIPTLEEVLSIAKGKSPILIEIKNQPNAKVVDALVSALKDYDGEFAIQSFNPFYINRVKKLAPHFIRGILGTECHAKNEGFIKKFLLKHLSLNFLIKPDFISYSYTGLPLSKRKTKNKVVIAWTVADQKTADNVKNYCDNIIFENFVPQSK